MRTVAEANAPFNEMMPTKDMRLEKIVREDRGPGAREVRRSPVDGAFVGVVPHPFFAVSSAAGEFSLVNVPEGDYEIEAWHEVFGRQTEKVKVKRARPSRCPSRSAPSDRGDPPGWSLRLPTLSSSLHAAAAESNDTLPAGCRRPFASWTKYSISSLPKEKATDSVISVPSVTLYELTDASERVIL